MARKKGDAPAGDSWMNTYADMVTLLLCFFAVMLSMSSVDQEKFNALVRSFQRTFPDLAPEDIGMRPSPDPNEDLDTLGTMSELYEELQEYVESQGMAGQIQLEEYDDVVYVRFNSDIFFEADRDTLRGESLPALGVIGDAIMAHDADISKIIVCGHTAETGRDTPVVSDWALSSSRAAAVAIYLDEQKGFDDARIMTIGYGKNYPVGDNETEEGRQLNRRVELIIIGTQSTLSFDVYASLQGTYQGTSQGEGVPDLANPEDETPLTPPAAPDDGGAPADGGTNTVQSEGANSLVEPDVSPYED